MTKILDKIDAMLCVAMLEIEIIQANLLGGVH